MNLSQVLTEALPELPPQYQLDRPPQVHPNLISREHLERDGVYVRSIIPGGPPHFFRMTKLQHQVAMLFDGKNSYAEVADLCAQRLKIRISEQEVKKFADMLEREEFFYKTPQEESEIIAHELTSQRNKVVKRKRAKVDTSTIELYYFNPAKMLDWMYAHFKWMYSPWWFAWSLVMIGVMFVILGSHWSTLWNDTLYFYNLTGQPLYHVFEFFGIFLVLAFIHESAHGMSCHHYGGKSHRMGFFLMYLAPGCFCDAAEAFVRAGRWGRIVTVGAGIWSEIVLCSYLSVLWWLTPPGSWVHNLAYVFILSGGVLAVLINWNPLSRMDGYFIFCDLLHFHDLKGQSTRYLVGLVRKYICHLPAKLPALPPLRRIGFVTYALLSGAYCYFLLGAFCRLTYRIMRFYWPLWAFVPATLLALLIFKSRIKKLARFLTELYLDKRDVMRKNWKPLAAGGAIALILLLLPLKRECVEEHFVLEPVQRAVLRAEVPGRVTDVLADEGQLVPAGASIVRLRDLGLESEAAEATSEYHMAAARARDAELRYTDYAAAEQRKLALATAYRVAGEEQQKLDIRAPFAGVVVTPRVRDLLGSYVIAGTEIAEIADLSNMRARVFVPETEMRKLETVSDNALRMESDWTARHGQVEAISASSRDLAPGLVPLPKYQGIRTPVHFTVDIILTNPDGHLRDGMTGVAKIYGRRRSILGSLLEPVEDAVARRLW